MVLSLASQPGMKPTWSVDTSDRISGRRQSDSIFAKSLVSTLRREMGRKLETRVWSLSRTVMWASRRQCGGSVVDVRVLNVER